MAPLTGKCLCGEVTLTMTPKKAEVHICHCGMCRRWTSSGFMGIEAAPGRLAHDGPARVRQTSDWAERAWCDSCGSTLWYRVTEPGPYEDSYHVGAGLFEGAAEFPLTEELCIDLKPAGYAFHGDHKKYTEAELLAMFAPDEGETP